MLNQQLSLIVVVFIESFEHDDLQFQINSKDIRSGVEEKLSQIDQNQVEPLPMGISTISNEHSCYINFINESIDYNKLFDFLMITPKQKHNSSIQQQQQFNDNLNLTILKYKEAVTEADFEKLPQKIKKLREKLRQTHSVTSYEFKPEISKDEAQGLFKSEMSFETWTEGQKQAVHQFLLLKLKTYVNLAISLISYETRQLLKEHSANNPRGYIKTQTDEKEVLNQINELTIELIRGIIFQVCEFTIKAYLKFKVETLEDLAMAQAIEQIIGQRYDIKLEKMGFGQGQARMLKCSDMFNDFTDWDNIKKIQQRVQDIHKTILDADDRDQSQDQIMLMRFNNQVRNYGYSVSDDFSTLPEWVVNEDQKMQEFFNLFFMRKGYPTKVAKRQLKVCMDYSIEVQEKKVDSIQQEMLKEYPSISTEAAVEEDRDDDDIVRVISSLEDDIGAIKKKKQVAKEDEEGKLESGQLLEDKIQSLLKSKRHQFTNKIANQQLIQKKK